MKKVKTICVLGILICAMSLFAEDQLSADLAGATTISESPHGSINGTNRTFTLSRGPSSEEPVRIFRNGVPLVPNVDYEINGPAITLAVNQTPIQGDRLTAMYVASRRSPEPAQFEATAKRSVQIEGPNEITIAAARAALKLEELQAVRSLASLLRQSPTNEQLSASSNNGPHSLDSLAMLNRQVAANSGKKKNVKHSTNKDAQGVDGLGDGPLTDINGSGLMMLQKRLRTNMSNEDQLSR